jgi:poly-beta-1,6-N-acetyl-D-glucosamine biosynthesis protein PgaD
LDQPGSGVQTLKPLIIHYSTASHPLVRLRDSILFLCCWAMWSVVVTAVINATEWEDLSLSLAGWFEAHLAFLNGLMASFHFPVEYVLLVIVLVCVFLIWSNLRQLLATQRHNEKGREGALSLDDLVRHFGLDIALIAAMQKETQVVVIHAPTGAVTGVRRAFPEVAANGDAKPLHLVV